MTANYQRSGTDLDSVFMARVTAKRGDCGFQVGGSDASNRWEKYTSGTQVAATGFKDSGNNDLAQLFQNISVALPPPVLTLSQPSYNNSGAGSALTFIPNLSVTVTGGTPTAYTWNIGSPTNGNWFVNAGQGTSSAQIAVNTVPSLKIARADVTVTVTVNGTNYTSSICGFTYQRTT